MFSHIIYLRHVEELPFSEWGEQLPYYQLAEVDANESESI